MHRLAQTCALLAIVGRATAALGIATPELVCDPTVQNRCAPVTKLLDGGYGLQVSCDNCGSTGSSPGGGLTDAQLRASPVPVGFDGGPVTCYQGGAWTGVGVTGPVTDTQLRASAVPVSAASLPLPSGAATSAAQTDGTQKAITRGGAKGATTAADLTGTAEGTDHQAADVQLYSGGAAYKGLVSGDAVDVNDRAARLLGKADVLVAAAAPSATNPLFVRLTDGTTAYVGFKAGDVIGALPAGSALIGAVKFSQTTSDNDVDVLTLPAVMTDRTQKTQLTDGTRDGTVKAASTAAAAADTSVVVALSPNSPIPTGANVIGAVTQSGTWTDRVVGNAGAAFDAANNAAPPANVLVGALETLSQGTQPTAATSTNVRRQLGTPEGVAYVQEGNSNRFSCVLQAVTVLTQCQAAPAAGLRAYVTSAHCSNQAATVQTLDIVFGTGTNCATSPVALTHKVQMGTNATTTSPQSWDPNFTTPLVPTAANAICVRPSAATAFGCTLTGFIAP